MMFMFMISISIGPDAGSQVVIAGLNSTIVDSPIKSIYIKI